MGIESRLVLAQGRKDWWTWGKVSAKGHRVSVWCNKIIVKLTVVTISQLYEYIETH